MSRGYWVKPAKGCYAPNRLISVIVSGSPVGESTARRGQGMAFASATIWESHRTRAGGWTAFSATVSEPAALHDLIESRSRQRSSTWIVSPSASSALTLSRFWDRVDTFEAMWKPRGKRPVTKSPPRGPGRAYPADTLPALAGSVSNRSGVPPAYIFSSLILRGKVDIVKYAVAGKTLTWVSASQYLPIQEAALAESLGFAWPRSGGPPPAGTFRLMSPIDRAELWALAFQRLSDWWLEVDGGPWRPTIGGLSESYFRHRLEPKTLLSHNDDYARSVEEAALFGGRASTWYYGTVGRAGQKGTDGSVGPERSPYGSTPGPVELWDVASMYPTILANAVFPVHHLHNWKAPSIPLVEDMLTRWGVIATVRIRSESGEYPVRDGDRVVYPVGEFDTALCGPELQRALADRSVVRIYHASSYALGRPFAKAAQSLIEARRGLQSSTDRAWGSFVKLLSNNFGGKMAQKKVGMVERPDVITETRWGGWGEGNHDRGTARRYLTIAGLTWELVEPRHKGRPLASCFCYLTAYGRSLMRTLRETLPAGRVVSQDTDGLWVTRATPAERTAVVRLAGSLGFRLRTDPPVQSGRWFGPKHYWTPHGWVLSGIRQERTWLGSLKWADGYTVNPVLGTPKAPPSMVYEVTRESDLTVIARDGVTGPDGWTMARRIGPPPAG